MPRDSFAAVYEIAADQFGYLTAAQARDAGVNAMALVMMERRQTVERVSHGVYRLVQLAHGPLAEYMEATLWVSVKGSSQATIPGHQKSRCIGSVIPGESR